MSNRPRTEEPNRQRSEMATELEKQQLNFLGRANKVVRT